MTTITLPYEKKKNSGEKYKGTQFLVCAAEIIYQNFDWTLSSLFKHKFVILITMVTMRNIHAARNMIIKTIFSPVNSMLYAVNHYMN